MKQYVSEILEELGWTDGCRIPVANEENRKLEDAIAEKTRKLIALKDELASEDMRWDELLKNEGNMQAEHKENTRLLYAYKEQLEREEHLKILADAENTRMEHEIAKTRNAIDEVQKRNDRMQNEVSLSLKRAENLKKSVIGDKGALEEWRAALNRSQADIDIITSFAKQDTTKAKELDIKAKQLQAEFDKAQATLAEVCVTATTNEKAAEVTSCQVSKAIEERRYIVSTWANSVDNLHQRDNDIKHLKEEMETLREHARRRNDKVLEAKHFLEQQMINNAEAERDCSEVNVELSRIKEYLRMLIYDNKTMESEVTAAKATLQSTAQRLENQRATNKRLYQEELENQKYLTNLQKQVEDLKPKLEEAKNTNKSAAQRLKELTGMVQKEERYSNNLAGEHQRLQNCLSRDQNTVLALNDEEKIWKMHMKVAKLSKVQLDHNVLDAGKRLMMLKEQIYNLEYQLHQSVAKLDMLESNEAAEAETDPERYAELEQRLEEVTTAVEQRNYRINMLATQSVKLNEEMRRLTKNIAENMKNYDYLKEKLMEMEMSVEGGSREMRKLREECAKLRVDEAVARLRVAHARRALSQLDSRVYSLDKQRLQLESAMTERKLEIGVRRSILDAQKRALAEDCGKLRADLKDREIRIAQLMKRYDLFISMLGKDEYGNQITATFYKIKFAQEKAELQEQGDQLDAEVHRGEQEIAALEATLKVVDAANKRYEESLNQGNRGESEQLEQMQEAFYKTKEVVDRLRAQLSWQDQRVKALHDDIKAIDNQEIAYLDQKTDLLEQWNTLKFELAEQTEKLQRAERIRRKNAAKARKRLSSLNKLDMFEVHVKDMYNQALIEAFNNAMKQLGELCFGQGSDPLLKEAILKMLSDRGLPAPPVPTSKLDKGDTKKSSEISIMLSGLQTRELSYQGSGTSEGRSSYTSLMPPEPKQDSYASSSRKLKSKVKQKYGERPQGEVSDSAAQRTSDTNTASTSVSRGGHSQLSMNVVMLGLDDTPVRDTDSVISSSSKRSNRPQ